MSKDEFHTYFNKIRNKDYSTSSLIDLYKSDYGGMETLFGSYTVLHAAAAWDRPNLLLYLIDKGYNIDTVCYYGLTSLHLACMNNREECVDILLKSGANVNIKDQQEKTCVDLANDKNYQSIIKERQTTAQ